MAMNPSKNMKVGREDTMLNFSKSDSQAPTPVADNIKFLLSQM